MQRSRQESRHLALEDGTARFDMTSSPTARLLLGLLVTLVAVILFSWYALYELNGLRKLQYDTVDRNRHDSLLLLRIQNDLNTLGLKMRDMTDARVSRGLRISGYQADFHGLRTDLEDAIYAESKLSPVNRRIDRQKQLLSALQEFWQSADAVFQSASAGHETEARDLVLSHLLSQQAMLAQLVSQFLERNNEAEARADKTIAEIYNGVEQNIYLFLAAALVMIVASSLYLTYSNRSIFDRIRALSMQRRVLAARLITVQEEVLRSVSRELHDEFGQILTAVGAMLTRAEKKGVPPDSPLRTELAEIKQITHTTLEKMRALSQMLHPAVLDDYGLAKAIEWYVDLFSRQTGMQVNACIQGEPTRITGQAAIHCFRIVQEALNNAAKHSGSTTARVELNFEGTDRLTITVSDSGCGLPVKKARTKPGLGLIAMQERAEILQAKLHIHSPQTGGTTVRLSMPLNHLVAPGEGTGITELIGRDFATNNS